MASVRIHIARLESRKCLVPKYLPMSFDQIDFGQVFFSSKLSEQIFCRQHGFWVHIGDLTQLLEVNTHPINTIFLLTITMVDDYCDIEGLMTPISSILSTSLCSSFLMAYGKGMLTSYLCIV